MNKLIILIFLLYVGFTQHLINGYNEMNDKLARVNDQLLASCTISTVQPSEKEGYK